MDGCELLVPDIPDMPDVLDGMSFADAVVIIVTVTVQRATRGGSQKCNGT